MQNLFLSVILMMALPLTLGARAALQQTDSASPPEQTIEALEHEFVRAALANDLPALERLWADDFEFTAPNGLVMPRSAYLAMMESKSVFYDRLELEGLKVRVYGDAATVTARVTVHGRAMDHVLDGVDHYLTVYVKRDGRWQQVATHALRIPGTTRSTAQ